MILFTAAEAAAAAGGRLWRGSGREEIRRAVVDSREVRAGDLFVAVPGARADGHDYVGQAFARGAAAALVSRPPAEGAAPAGEAGTPEGDPGAPDGSGPGGGALILVDDTVAALGRLAAHHRRRFPVEVVGVTGSVGKTTTKEMIAAVLARRFRVLKSPGNYNTEIGLPLTLLGLRPEHQVAVLEMGMRGEGQIRYLAGIAAPRLGVLTVIAETHVELLGSVEAVARAKRELIEALPADGVAVLNADDPRQRRMPEATAARVLWYGLGEGAQVTAVDVRPRGPAGTAFRLRAPGFAEVPVTLPLPGRHHVLDALAAAAAGLALGVPPEEAAGGLESLSLPDKRSRLLLSGGLTLIDDTYNASPASMKAALATLEEVAGGRRVAVLGDMLELGERAEAGHREVGRAAAAAGVDLLVTVGDLSRHVREGALEAGLPAERARHYAGRAAAAAWLCKALRPGDTVLVKGSRGMRMEEVVEALAAWTPGPEDAA